MNQQPTSVDGPGRAHSRYSTRCVAGWVHGLPAWWWSLIAIAGVATLVANAVQGGVALWLSGLVAVGLALNGWCAWHSVSCRARR